MNVQSAGMTLVTMDSFIESLYDMRCSNGFIRSDAPADLQ